LSIPIRLPAIVSRLIDSVIRHTSSRRERQAQKLLGLIPSPVMNSISDVVLVIDTETRTIGFANSAVQSVFGYRPEEVLGRDTRFLHVDDDAFLRFSREFDPALDRHGTFRTEYTMKRRDGTVFPAEITVTELDSESGWHAGVVSWIRDLSDQKETQQKLALQEEQIHHAMRMDSIGRLAGGVAHDFNNILTVIGGYLHIAKQSLDPEHPAWSALENIGNAGNRAADLTKQLLLFSRKGPSEEYLPFDINKSIAGIARLLRRLIGENITLDVALSQEKLFVLGDEGKIDQVIMNLVLNARDALPEGGTIAIATAADADSEQRMVLTVADTGIGMDQKTVQRVFDPFFTTKSREMGTGLGLSVVYGIVQEHQGQISIDSAPRAGTTVTVTLPRADAPPAEEITAQPETTESTMQIRRILIVEDERAVIDVVASGLSRVGYEVTAATSLAGAVQAWQEARKDFDAIIADVVLPDGSGVSLIELLKPPSKTRIVFASGYLEDKKEFEMIRSGGYQFLHKPYAITDLRTLLEKGES
jgi:two-component system, cell cycle sensor histidine kinase and response regulator CckA